MQTLDQTLVHLFYFSRSVRTAASESYIVWLERSPSDQRGRVGHIDLHFSNQTVYGTIALELGLLDDERDALLAQIDDQLIGAERSDFVFTLFQARERGFYSDIVTGEDRKAEAATRADVDRVRESLSQVVGRLQSARGKLTEHAVVTYFEKNGYSAKLGGPDLDASKVDVVAESGTEVIYVQSKLGAISGREVRKVVTAIAGLRASGEKTRVAGIVARTFPDNIEFIRKELENEFRIPVLCVHLAQVASAAPEYKRTLSA